MVENQNNEAPVDQQVAIITTSLEVFKTAPEILNSNRDRTAKAVAIGMSIMEQWQAAWAIKDVDQMLAELAKADERSNKYLVNCSTALSIEKESRAPITQLMDSFKTMFTDAEKELDRAGKDTIPSKVQLNRNSYAKKLAEVQEEKRKAAQLIQDRNVEVITIKAEAEKRLFSKYTEYLVNVKTRMISAFNGLTLETWDAETLKIKNYVPALKKEAVEGFQLNIFAKYHTNDEVLAIVKVLTDEKFTDYASNYVTELSLLRDELVDKFASKKAELEDIKRIADEAEANRIKLQNEKNAEAKKKLEEEQEKLKADQQKLNDDKIKREQEAQQQINTAAADAEQANSEKVDVSAQGEVTMQMFEKEAAITNTEKQPEVRKSWEIIVLHQVGYTQIFQLWFEKVGKDMPIDKLGATKLDSMKTFCEKLAKDKGTFIEGKFLRYDESFKTVARKEKVV